MALISNVPKETALAVRVSSTMTLIAEVKGGSGPVDLTGAVIAGEVGATALTATITDALNGKFTLEIPPSAVSVVVETTWYLDLTDSMSRVTPLFRGPVSVVE